jgi:hypothetical protein
MRALTSIDKELMMTRWIVSSVLPAAIALAATPIAAQTWQTDAGPAKHNLELMAQPSTMARAALETRVTKERPYTADAITEFVQVLGDGNRIVRKSTARLFRDGDGRTRREDQPEQAGADGAVVITDPVAGASLILDSRTKTAFKAPAMFARTQAAGGTAAFVDTGMPTANAGEPKTTTTIERRGNAAQFTVTEQGGAVRTFTLADRGPIAWTSAQGETRTETLGEQTIEGVTATGTRIVTVIPAGAIGNEQTITIVSEQWFSSDLQMLVLTRHSDPRVGETTYRVTNITRTEPDSSLFQVPADYTIQNRASLMLRK